jgi:predicted nucleic acid-binding protein
VAEGRRALLDSGFVIALLSADDPDHPRCVEAWRSVRAALFTVDGVLVECAHMLRRARGGAGAVVDLVYGAGTEVVPTTPERARRAVALMDKYHDVPMDFVDALLVVVAEERRIRDVLTLDRRGFDTYRLNGRDSFRIMPPQ